MKATASKLVVVAAITLILGAAAQAIAARYVWECKPWGCAWVYVPSYTPYGCY